MLLTTRPMLEMNIINSFNRYPEADNEKSERRELIPNYELKNDHFPNLRPGFTKTDPLSQVHGYVRSPFSSHADVNFLRRVAEPAAPVPLRGSVCDRRRLAL